MRVAGSGRWSGDMSPTDVESPMCTTEVHDVRALAAAAVVVGAALGPTALDAVGAGAETAVVAATESAEDERDPSTHAAITASTTTSTAGMANARGSVTGAGRYRRGATETERSGRWDLR
jgi:hypothetical protein